MKITQYIQMFFIFLQLVLAVNIWASSKLLKRYNNMFKEYSFYVNPNENFWKRMFISVFYFFNLKKLDEENKYKYLRSKYNYVVSNNYWGTEDEKKEIVNELSLFERTMKIKRLKRKSSKNLLKRLNF